MHDDVDILSIHSDILNNFKQQEQKIPLLQQRLQELKHILNNNNEERITHVINEEINELQKIINCLESKELYHFYLLQTTPLLENYKKELQKPLQVSFMGEISKPDTIVIDEIKKSYLSVAKKIKYLPELNIIKNIENICSYCQQKQIEQIDINTFVCKSCGFDVELPQIAFSYKDSERINIVPKYTYDRRIHFKDTINQFQGKQNSTIATEVYDQLIEKCKIHKLIDENATSLQDKFKKVTKQHIFIFLKETGFSKHYEDIKLIYYNLTGTPLDDISHLEEQLMQDFDTLSNLYDQQYIQTKKINRKNFINTQYVLYQLLKRHKYPCDKRDFNFLKTTDRKNFHDEICSNLFDQLGWNFSVLF